MTYSIHLTLTPETVTQATPILTALGFTIDPTGHTMTFADPDLPAQALTALKVYNDIAEHSDFNGPEDLPWLARLSRHSRQLTTLGTTTLNTLVAHVIDTEYDSWDQIYLSPVIVLTWAVAQQLITNRD